jgi:putative phosphoesterase
LHLEAFLDREGQVVHNELRMRVGLVSDTHIPNVEEVLPAEVMQALEGVDLILHAGDIYALSVLDDLERIAPVLAASGDDDYGDTLRDTRVKNKHVVKLEGKTLWLIHERPFPFEFTPRRAYMSQGPSSTWQQVPDAPDVVVFGHEHRTVVQDHNGILFVNPGSPTFLNYRRGLGTVGILDIDSGQPQVQIVQL